MSRHTRPRRVPGWGSVALTVVLVLAAGWVWLYKPIPPAMPDTTYSQPGVTTPLLAVEQEAPSATVTAAPVVTVERACDKPVSYRMFDPGATVPFIDTTVVPIGLENGVLGDPSPADKGRIGLYTGGPQPGSSAGNVLIDGHTYQDGTSVFKPNFTERLALGMRVEIGCQNGQVFGYRVIKLWRAIDKWGEYPQLVVSEKFYDFEGPSQLFGVTCTGSWNFERRTSNAVAAFIAANEVDVIRLTRRQQLLERAMP
ncbi:MAG: class F sortase [Candidatus Saccharimonas sp.]